MTIAIKTTPRHAPGQGVAQAMHRSQQWVKSEAVAFGATSPMNIFEVPGNVLITGGFVEVTTAFGVAGSSPAATLAITAPNSTSGTNTLWDAAGVGLQTLGFKAFTTPSLTPASGGYVIGTYDAGTSGTGGFNVYLSYVEPEDEL